MTNPVARWRDWTDTGIEHLVLNLGAQGADAEAVVAGSSDGFYFGVHYPIVCDAEWRVRRVEVRIMGRSEPLIRAGDGAGRWRDGSGVTMSGIDGAIDVDL